MILFSPYIYLNFLASSIRNRTANNNNAIGNVQVCFFCPGIVLHCITKSFCSWFVIKTKPVYLLTVYLHFLGFLRSLEMKKCLWECLENRQTSQYFQQFLERVLVPVLIYCCLLLFLFVVSFLFVFFIFVYMFILRNLKTIPTPNTKWLRTLMILTMHCSYVVIPTCYLLLDIFRK